MTDKPTTRHVPEEDGDTQGSLSAKRVVNIDDFNNMIAVLIGRHEQQFVLHQDVICSKSKFFKAACSKRWREGQEKLVRLAEVHPDTFKTYFDWLYSGQSLKLICAKDSDIYQQSLEIERLINLHLLGETLDDIQLRNHTITMLFQSMRNHNLILHPSHFRLVWESTPPRSQLRKMLVHAVIAKVKSEAFANKVTEYPSEFVQDVAVALMAKSSVVTWGKASERLPEFQEVEEAD